MPVPLIPLFQRSLWKKQRDKKNEEDILKCTQKPWLFGSARSRVESLRRAARACLARQIGRLIALLREASSCSLSKASFQPVPKTGPYMQSSLFPHGLIIPLIGVITERYTNRHGFILITSRSKHHPSEGKLAHGEMKTSKRLHVFRGWFCKEFSVFLLLCWHHDSSLTAVSWKISASITAIWLSCQ